MIQISTQVHLVVQLATPQQPVNFAEANELRNHENGIDTKAIISLLVGDSLDSMTRKSGV